MPRRTAEAISGALFRARQGRPPDPPKSLDAEAAKVWRQLAASRPSDWFDSAGEVLLARLSRTVVHAEKLHDQLDVTEIDTPASGQLLRRVAAINASIVSMMTRLRLTPQSTISWDQTGRKNERGTERDPLIGGFATADWHPRESAN